MSAPTSAMTSAASWLMASPGRVPAEYTSTRVPVAWAWWRIRAAAIWDLPPFLTQTNNTLGTGCGVVMSLGACFCWGRGGAERGHRGVLRVEFGTSPQGHIDETDQHGHLNQWSHDSGQGPARGDPAGSDGRSVGVCKGVT